jgi:16S rRNA (cytosine1402-N4)-methyltransferase
MSNGESGKHSGHEPVMLAEACSYLVTRRDGRYLDGTFGGGGHTAAILTETAPAGTVLAIDADPAAERRAQSIAHDSGVDGRLRFVHGNFECLATIARDAGFVPLDGVLLDLGLSSFQLDDPERGFSFRFDAPIDMRFDPTHGSPASDLVNNLPAADLADIIWRYGDEQRSRRIASAIERERDRAPLSSTSQLATVIERAVGGRRGSETHPATRTFQALRIAVNDELSVLERALDSAVDVLAPGGRLVVISFHSLEDRIVKRFIQRESATCICPPEQPVCTCNHVPRLRSLTRGVKPGRDEVARNPRSRSAVLRAAERLAGDDNSTGAG